MSNKKTQCYEHLFNFIETNVCSLRCSSFMTDYETPMRNALKNCYPHSDFFSCWIHFKQAAKRQAIKMGSFFDYLKKNDKALLLYHKFLCLPLLPPHLILDAFDMLVREAKAISGTRFDRFIRYFERQWLIRVSYLSSLFVKLIIIQLHQQFRK